MATQSVPFKTPLVELRWVNISGKGKLKYDPTGALDENDPKNYQYVATAVMTEKQAEEVKKQLDKIWKENKPQGATRPKYDIVKPAMVKTDKKDEYGEPIKVQETNDKGEKLYEMVFKTGTVFPDGSPQKIKVLRANGTPVNLGDKKIGNGSIGVIHGAIGINGFKGNEGLLAFLKAIQLKKFVEYSETDSIEAEDLGDDTEGLDGLEDTPEDTTAQPGPSL